MYRALAVILAWLLTAPVMAFGPGESRSGWAMVNDNPEGVLTQWQNDQGRTPSLETERLLLIAYAHHALNHKPELEALLTQLREHQFTPQQQARMMMLDGLYAGSMRSEFDYALQQFDAANLALSGMDDNDSLRLQVQILTLAGSLLRYLERLPEAIERLGQARQRAVALGDKGTLADIEHHLGRALRVAEQPRLAAEHYRSALSLAEFVDNPRFPGLLELELARLYRGINEYSRALEHAHNAAAIFEPLNEPLRLANALSELGTAYRELGEPAQSLHHYMLALDLQLREESVLAIARTRHQIALTYLDAGEPDKSLEYLQLALQAVTERKHDKLIFATRLALSETYLSLGRWNDALLLAEQLLVQSRQQEDKPSERTLLMVMAEANRALSRTEQAWGQLRQAADIALPAPANGGLSAANQLAEQQLRNQLQRQGEALNESKQLLNNLQNQRLLIVLLLVALSLSLLLLWYRHRHKGSQLSRLHDEVLTLADTGAGNRKALFQHLSASESGYLVLLKLGDLPTSELRTGQAHFTQQRQRLITLLKEEGWVDRLFEPNLGLVAMTIQQEIPLEREMLRLFDRLQRAFRGHNAFSGPISAGIIPLPFQPGALLRLPPEQALELTQLALWSANDLAHRTDCDQFVQLRPVALSAPLLNPEQLYASAVKGIQHGVIRCLVSNGQEELRWPVEPSAPEDSAERQDISAQIAPE